jgi:hypothetical protein
MQYFLSLLPVLACPIGMGLMMWFMMRGNKDQSTRESGQMSMSTDSKPREVTNESPKGASILKMLFMCLNWKVVAGLAVVGLIVWVVAPQFVWAALPVLLVAACPLSMLFMMRGMSGGANQRAAQPLETNEPPGIGLADEERQSRLLRLRAEQEAIASQIDELDRSRESALSDGVEAAAPAVDQQDRIHAPRRRR